MQPEKPLEEEIDKALNRQTSEDDTHPSPVDPFRLYAPINPIAEYKLATCYTHLGYSSKARGISRELKNSGSRRILMSEIPSLRANASSPKEQLSQKERSGDEKRACRGQTSSRSAWRGLSSQVDRSSNIFLYYDM
jgi:hypothetical protein